MKKTEILILDEDVLARQAVASILQGEADLEVSVSNHVAAGEKEVEREHPDLVLLNVDDAGSDGFNTLISLRVRYPDLPVIVLSPRSEKGAEVAIQALRHGAFEVITKPEQRNQLLFADGHLSKRLIPAVRAATKTEETKWLEAQMLESSRTDGPFTDDPYASRKRNGREQPVRCITIGSGTGGPKTVFKLLSDLPDDLPVPVVIVQHFPRHYTSALAQTLNRAIPFPVEEAWDGADLEPGTVWIAPGGYHCEIARSGNRHTLQMHRGPRENEVRPSADVLFHSAVNCFGDGVMGVLLSGSGRDGYDGARALRAAGGEVMIQDPRTAPASDLPLSLVKAGAGRYYRPDRLGEQIARRLMRDQLIGSRKEMLRASPGRPEEGRQIGYQ